MSFPNLCLRLVGWLDKLISPPDSQDDPGTPPEAPKPEAAMPKYAAIRHAVESKLEHLVRHEIPEHRELAENDSLELYYVEIEATTDDGQALLDAFCKEFNPAARQHWIRKFFGANATVKLDCLAGVFRSADLPSTAGLDAHLQILNQGTPAAFRVRLWSKWVQAAPDISPHSASVVRGSAVVLRIRDSQGQHDDIRRETYPIKLGRQSEITIEGTFASAGHCTLHWRGGRVELEDHSKNGTWIDGVRLQQQSKPLSLGKHQIKLGKGQGEIKDYPEIELDILTETATPISQPTPLNTPTPIASDMQALLAVLSAQDATGNPLIDVLALPFSIGRGTKYGYSMPPAHEGVSGTSGPHLIIEAIDDQGAEVSNEAHAKNGTLLGGTLQGERFHWPFGEEITLAPKWKNAPPVSILLKRPG